MTQIDLAIQDNYLENKLGEKTSWLSLSQGEQETLVDLFSQVYQFFGAENNYDLVLTDSHEESLTQVFSSHYQRHIFSSGKCHIVTIDCISSCQRELLLEQKKFGVEHSFIQKDEKGLINKVSLEECITPKTSLVSISLAHPVTGIIQPLNDVIEVCQKFDVALHVDVFGSLGNFDISMKDLKIDYLTFYLDSLSSKGYPSGVVARPFMQLQPLIPGYGIQKLKGGNFSLDKLKTLALTLKATQESMYENLLELPRLKKSFIRSFEENFSDGVVLLKGVETLPSIILIAFPYLLAEYLLFALHQRGILASFGGNRFPKLKYLLSFSKESEMLKQCAISLNIGKLKDKDLLEVIKSIKQAKSKIEKTYKNVARNLT